MTEKLKGQYTYGESYPESLKGKSVPFEIEWTLVEGVITGSCVDEETQDVFNKPATVKGFIDDNIISFIKKYPKFWEIDENEMITLFNNIPPPEIHYSGIFIDDHFEGDWEMPIIYILENGETREYNWIGTWTMQRIE